MSKLPQIQKLLHRSRRLPVLATLLAVVILGVVILLTTLQVRQGIRRQIAGRDGEVLYAVARMYYQEDIELGLSGPVETTADALGVVLKSSQLRGVLGVRLYDARGHFVQSFPPYVLESPLDTNLLAQVTTLRPVTRFHPEM